MHSTDKFHPESEPGHAYVIDRFVPLAEACIPLLDWGFNKSDAVYDGIPFSAGRIFRLDDHLNRFEGSMRKWRLPKPASLEKIADICHDLVALSGLQDGILYIYTTRGVPPSAAIRDPSKFHSRLYGWSQEVPKLGTTDKLKSGLSMIIAHVPRIPSESVNATAKNLHWGDLIQARLEAADRGAQNAILLRGDGYVAEGVGFNVFALVDGQLRTPDRDCLHGITRRTIIEIAESANIDHAIADISADELRGATELFITSSAGGVFGVTELDGQPVGEGSIGPLTQQIHDEYWQRRLSPKWTVAVDYDSPRHRQAGAGA